MDASADTIAAHMVIPYRTLTAKKIKTYGESLAAVSGVLGTPLPPAEPQS